MNAEQAQSRLDEIRRLLEERDNLAKGVRAIEEQIAELAGVEKSSRPTTRRPLSRDSFRNLCGVVRT